MSTKDAGSKSGDGVECPTCGKDGFKSETGVKIHHTHAHGESIRPTVECAWCGDEKTVSPSGIERSEKHFCGDDCYAAWKSENVVGEDHHQYTDRVTVECAWCGEQIELVPSRVENHERHFCPDTDCQANWLSENKSGEDAVGWGGGSVTVECAWCGEEKEVCQWAFDRRKRFFCGNNGECQGKWLSENRSGENAHRWNGGEYPYGEGFGPSLKETVRERQDRQCAGCGAHESTQPMALDVHHIQKARNIDDAEQRNDDQNLVAVCRQCHPQFDQMSPLRPQTPYLD